MTPEAETALIELGVRVGGIFIERILIPWIESLITAQVSPPEAMGIAYDIVSGIEQGHPDWDGPTKADYALSALSLYYARKGKAPVDRDLRLAIEAAVQQLNGGRYGTDQPVPAPGDDSGAQR